ncbi:hypothetical protein [Streptomyces sp. SPB162]|uniref:hypothetical protein n=1 Tax=Streptomyces sp. SPB162 TaxID=2940560 RepID=UPI00240572BE|nr:hypothetical protein [Streptomyces sp. SPB162]
MPLLAIGGLTSSLLVASTGASSPAYATCTDAVPPAQPTTGQPAAAATVTPGCGPTPTPLPTTTDTSGPTPTATPPASPSALGVTVGSDGWITYTTTRASSLALTDVTTSTLTGTVAADGTCEFSATGTAAAGSAATYQEETAYNPTTCQEKILVGGLSAAAETSLTDPADAANTVTTSSNSAEATPGSDPDWGGFTYYKAAYTKTAWIDPVYITITSLTANLQWPLYGKGGYLYGRVNPYEFRYDGWSNSGTPPISFHTMSDNSGWYLLEAERFRNVDFEYYILAAFGVAGWAACGFTTAPAVFQHRVQVSGYRNGARGWAWNDSKSGGCANLVHHGQWNNYGWTS